MKNRWLILFGASVLLAMTSARGSDEAIAYGTDYSNDECGKGTLIYADNWAQTWDAKFEDWIDDNDWDISRYRTGSNVQARYFTNTSIGYGEDDTTYGIDNADISAFFGHGGCYHNSQGGCGNSGNLKASYMWMDQSDDTCRPRTSYHIALGNTDNNMFFVKGCRTAQYIIATGPSGGNYDHVAVNGTYMAMWSGMHGSSHHYPAWWKLTPWMNQSHDSGAGANWLTKLTWAPGGQQDCALVVVFAENDEDYLYDAGLDNWEVGLVGDNSGQGTAFWISECNPASAGDPTLPE